MIYCEICETDKLQTPAVYFAYVDQSGEFSGLLFNGYVCQEHATQLAADVKHFKSKTHNRTLTIRSLGE